MPKKAKSCKHKMYNPIYQPVDNRETVVKWEPHVHDILKCSDCNKLHKLGLSTRGRSFWLQFFLAFSVVAWASTAYVLWDMCHTLPPEPVRIEYPVYRPDPETSAKLQACQDEWRDDQITKKLLRMKLKKMELND